jgi:hypothetical protein
MNEELELKKWIVLHKVCWELLPHQTVVDGKIIQLGFELHLYAQHFQGVRANPGCEECYELYKKLPEIALQVLPVENCPTRYEITPFNSSFHMRPKNNLKTEVQLMLLIIHRTNYMNPVDDCEVKCSAEIQKKLKEIGVQMKIWRQKRNPSGDIVGERRTKLSLLQTL